MQREEKVFGEGRAEARQGWGTTERQVIQLAGSRVPAASVAAMLPGSHPLALPLSLAPVGTEASVPVPLMWPVDHCQVIDSLNQVVPR